MSTKFPSIGVLDIQGSVEEHLTALRRCGVNPVSVKNAEDLARVDGLIIPGRIDDNRKIDEKVWFGWGNYKTGTAPPHSNHLGHLRRRDFCWQKNLKSAVGFSISNECGNFA